MFFLPRGAQREQTLPPYLSRPRSGLRCQSRGPLHSLKATGPDGEVAGALFPSRRSRVQIGFARAAPWSRYGADRVVDGVHGRADECVSVRRADRGREEERREEERTPGVTVTARNTCNREDAARRRE
ncbi:hypothetical protein SKAU_G00104790 [Synaphobranchus kaupii]|uniref:Uncharacterized protein n=1 Tax=Synaphobranchus kaupii TaxID=118154 RepID=A0A9Q1FZA1_SYNKA|nr:hypothetical protein SKAU_G00104790 [Synaphobranchus kaupii]